ncbi:MAG: hypothetical protein ABI147_11945 [Acidobacteriaceae bacterium]
MLQTLIGPSKNTPPSKSPLLSPPAMPRRTGHGGIAWASSPSTGAPKLYQPQDGAIESRGRVTDIASRLFKFSAGEPEDARLTGGTRSLMRRLSGLNLGQLVRPKAPKSALNTPLPTTKVA